MRIAIKTLGCRANRYESDKLLEELGEKADFVDENEGADVIVVNTCTVTHVADRKSRQAVSQLKRSFPNAKIAVFGCGARMAREQYEEMDFVDYIAFDRKDLAEFILQQKGTGLAHDGLFFSRNRVDSERTRSLVKIQDGCNRFCTYCIIPFTRGLPRSFSIEEILEEVKYKVQKGYKEIVITGINIGMWEQGDLRFADLLETILDKTSIERVRISSIEPCDFTERFYKIMQHPRICDHLHLCIQAGSDEVLKAMGRHYDTAEFEMICNKLYEAVPSLAITTDVIVGFPGETPEAFDKGLDFIEKMKFAKLHVFPFSKRKNTPANDYKNVVPYPEKQQRVHRLLALSRTLERSFKERFLSTTMPVLIEGKNRRGKWQGITSNYIKVEVESDKDLTNEIVEVELQRLLPRGVVRGTLV